MPYNQQLPTDKDKVRHKIGDIYEDLEFLSDSEIEFILEENGGNINLASADGCFAIAARLARNTNYKFSTLWQDASQAYKHFMDLGKRFLDAADVGGSLSPAFTGDEDRDNIFYVGMFDNLG